MVGFFFFYQLKQIVYQMLLVVVLGMLYFTVYQIRHRDILLSYLYSKLSSWKEVDILSKMEQLRTKPNQSCCAV